MNSIMPDLRYALRQLRKAPTFALTAIVTLALGIGANTAIITVFNQVLLRMLPVVLVVMLAASMEPTKALRTE
jgi:hypothetical protein